MLLKNNVRQMLEEAGVRTKTINKANEFGIQCIICHDEIFRCYVNPTKVVHGIKGWCHCYRRGCSYTVKHLLRHYGIKGYNTEEIEYQPTTFEKVKDRLMLLGTFDLNFGSETEEVKIYEDYDWDKFKNPLTNKSDMARRARAYLSNRGFIDEQIELYDLRYADEGDYSGRIIIPFRENEKLVYFQAR